MAKKSRRTRNTPRLSSAQLTGVASGASLPRVEGELVRPAGERSARRTVQEDYSHVVADLKRIATIAGTLLVIMIILSLVLPQFIR